MKQRGEALLYLTEGLMKTITRKPVVDHLLEGEECLSEVYTPDPVSRAVYLAGLLLRHYPDTELHHSQVAVRDCDNSKLAIQAFAGIVNTSIERVDVGKPTFSSKMPGKVRHHCKEAEGRFLWAISRIVSDRKSEYALPPAAVIVHDADKDPVLFGKKVGDASYLSLRPVVIDGVRYPEGSIIDARFETEDLEKMACTSNGTYAEIASSRVISAGFLRLSRFALTKREQKDWRTACIPPEYMPRIGDMTTKDVKSDVEAAIQAVHADIVYNRS